VFASLKATTSTLSVLNTNTAQLVFTLDLPVGNDTYLSLASHSEHKTRVIPPFSEENQG